MYWRQSSRFPKTSCKWNGWGSVGRSSRDSIFEKKSFQELTLPFSTPSLNYHHQMTRNEIHHQWISDMRLAGSVLKVTRVNCHLQPLKEKDGWAVAL